MFPPFLCHLPFRLSASLYIFFGKAKSTNYFTDSLMMILLFGLAVITNANGENTATRKKQDDRKNDAYPLICNGVLLGGYSNNQWLDENTILDKISGKEKYKIYSFDSFLGEVVGKKTADRDGKVEIKHTGFAPHDYVAISCPWNALPRVPKKLSSKNKQYQEIVQKILISHGLGKDIPINIRQIVKVDLEGDGVDEVLIAADNITPPARAYYRNNEYSILLLRKVIGGGVKNIFIAKDIIITKKEFEEITPVTHEVKSFIDADGDGILEVMIQSEYYEGISYGLYKVVGDEIKLLLEATVGE